ncbi:tRNA-splicing endonuclease subunit sen54 N-term-domain-containing protein [Phellopilus nigrolimitatus]|nr:tRNA-splicing endonuclease subunit sen54 N-term-domain-containing protein [Phellopilus nigrolimitatus]
MDDILEQPTPTVPTSVVNDPENDSAESSDEDDGAPDWTRLSALASASARANSANRPVIPKRGEKEFEPVGGVSGSGARGTGTDLQQHKLERVRAAMFSALDVERRVSSKVVSYAVWKPDIARACVLSARGNHLLSMGHNVPRDVCSEGLAEPGEVKEGAQKEKKVEKVVELLPEEALYLVERGSMFCWAQVDGMRHDRCEDLEGTPMTVQQAYMDMIGREDLTLERYQVFAYLKRLGYTVTRARPPDAFYTIPPPFPKASSTKTSAGVLARLAELFIAPFRTVFGSSSTKIDWWRPLGTGGLLHRFLSYSSVFSTLRFIPSGYKLPMSQPSDSSIDSPPLQTSSPYEVFFNLYKPATSYRKTAPPPPDYSLIVVNGRTTPMPTLHELSRLFDELPELPLPGPRKRPPQAQPALNKDSKAETGQIPLIQPSPPLSVFQRILQLLRSLFHRRNDMDKDPPPRPRRPNPFQVLKTGKKMIVIAAVDAGMISFFRFGQGSFDEWPMA